MMVMLPLAHTLAFGRILEIELQGTEQGVRRMWISVLKGS
jgi:hypothetical protein